jgi:hypothetical protein
VLLGDADRELLYEALGRHAAEGRLDVSELERRVAIVAGADTREAAAEAMAGLPPVVPAPEEHRPRWGRGHGESEKPEPDWQPTSERFRDPRTRNVLRVWVDADGGRHYVAE